MKRSGHADLPLHSGRVPHWLAHRMASLGGAISESIILGYGKDEFLARLADPFWFQAFGCVLGMDWHSSGITTSVIGALKRALSPKAAELGLYICGGRGRHSLKTPEELTAVGEKTGLDATQLVRASRLSARVDNNAVADGSAAIQSSCGILPPRPRTFRHRSNRRRASAKLFNCARRRIGRPRPKSK